MGIGGSADVFEVSRSQRQCGRETQEDSVWQLGSEIEATESKKRQVCTGSQCGVYGVDLPLLLLAGPTAPYYVSEANQDTGSWVSQGTRR